MQVQGEDKPYDDINITPMLDLAYVLLVIFILMCTATVEGIRVDIPKASKSPAKSDKKPKVKSITIASDGKISLDGAPVTLDQLQQQLTQEKQHTPDLPVVVRGDSVTQYQAVASVIDVTQKVGIIKVGLATLPTAK